MKTILVVDDFASVRFFHASLLKRAAYRTVTAASGREALAVVGREPVDLVLLDLLMPDLNGAEVVRELRAEARFRGLPVLVVTSETHHPLLAGIQADPACAVLIKPLLPAALQAAVARALHPQPAGI